MKSEYLRNCQPSVLQRDNNMPHTRDILTLVCYYGAFPDDVCSVPELTDLFLRCESGVKHGRRHSCVTTALERV